MSDQSQKEVHDADKRMAEWADTLNSVLRDMEYRLLQDVVETGEPPDLRLRNFVIGVSGVLAALKLDSGHELDRAMKNGKRYLKDLVVQSKSNGDLWTKLSTLPIDLLESRKSVLMQLLRLFEGPTQLTRKLQQQDELEAKAAADSVARTIVGTVSEEPLISLPFLLPSPQRRKGSTSKLLPLDYADKSRRKLGVANVVNAILRSKPSKKDGTVTRAAITAAFQAAGLEMTESKLFNF